MTYREIVQGAKKPQIINFAIIPQGILIDNRLFPYSSLKSFWLSYEPPLRKELSITSKKVLMPRIIISLEDVDPNEIRKILLQFLEEEHHEDSLIDILTKIIKF